MAAAAQAGGHTSGAPASDPSTPPPVAAIGVTIADKYAKELHANMEAHRSMRWVAFSVIGIVSFMFLMALLGVLMSIFSAEDPPAILTVQAADWHAWVFVGLALVVFAMIPLSLLMALVRMISANEEEAAEGIKSPSIEAGKLLYGMIKGFVSQAKGGPE